MRRANRKSWLLLAILAYLASGTCFFRLYHSRPSNTRLRATEKDQGKPLLRPPFQFYRLARREADELRVDVTEYLSNISMLAKDFKDSYEIINREEFQAALRKAMLEKEFTLVLGGKNLGKTLIKNHTVHQMENVENSRLTILDVNMRKDPDKPLFAWIFDRIEVKCESIQTFAQKLWEISRDKASPKQVLEDVIRTIREETGNATCILVDEANVALPGKDETQAFSALQYFVMLTKETSQASVVLISSEFAYPYRLQRAGMSLRDIKNIIVANEIPKEEMVEIMVTKWKMSQELAEEFYLYFGGDVDLCERAVEKLIQKGDNFDPITDILDSGGLSMCANNPGARKHLQKMADQGWSPVNNVDEDAAAKLIAKKNVGGVLPKTAQIFDRPKDMFTDEHEYALVPAGTLMRWKIAKKLELPLDTSMSAEPKPVWVRQLREDGAGGFELAGNAFQIDPAPTNVDYLKKAIKKEEELGIAASKIEVYSQEDGSWKKESKMSASLRDNDEDSPYGYFLP